jgi:hypothetical protein
MGYPGGKSTGIGFECIAQIGVGLRGEARARNPDCGAIAGHGVWAKIYLRCKAVFGGGRQDACARGLTASKNSGAPGTWAVSVWRCNGPATYCLGDCVPVRSFEETRPRGYDAVKALTLGQNQGHARALAAKMPEKGCFRRWVAVILCIQCRVWGAFPLAAVLGLAGFGRKTVARVLVALYGQ